MALFSAIAGLRYGNNDPSMAPAEFRELCLWLLLLGVACPVGIMTHETVENSGLIAPVRGLLMFACFVLSTVGPLAVVILSIGVFAQMEG